MARPVSISSNFPCVSRKRKLEVFRATVVPKLLSGLTSACLCKAARRSLDAFHAKCLRRILTIPSSYVSGVSNEQVRSLAQEPALSLQLSRRQFILLGKVFREPEPSRLRSSLFADEGLSLLTEHCVRKVGRPRKTWGREVLNLGIRVAGSTAALTEALKNVNTCTALADKVLLLPAF